MTVPALAAAYLRDNPGKQPARDTWQPRDREAADQRRAEQNRERLEEYRLQAAEDAA